MTLYFQNVEYPIAMSYTSVLVSQNVKETNTDSLVFEVSFPLRVSSFMLDSNVK